MTKQQKANMSPGCSKRASRPGMVVQFTFVSYFGILSRKYRLREYLTVKCWQWQKKKKKKSRRTWIDMDREIPALWKPGLTNAGMLPLGPQLSIIPRWAKLSNHHPQICPCTTHTPKCCKFAIMWVWVPIACNRNEHKVQSLTFLSDTQEALRAPV